VGGRLDYEFYGGFQPSARAALSYKLDDNSILFGAVSRAFHMPLAARRFLKICMFDGLAYTTSERGGVTPPSLIAYELGYRGNLFDRLDLSLNLFWHEYDNGDGLVPKLGPPGLLCMHYDNFEGGGESSLYGVELDARYKVVDRLTLLGNYTFQQLDWRTANPFFFQDFPTPPEHKFMLGTQYDPTDDLHLSSYLYYVDATKAPNCAMPIVARHVHPYFRLDLRAEYELWNDQASVAVGVSNLLDPDHYEGGTMFFNSAEVPRMVYAEFRVNIK
jgi:outer membrane receptor protein involved in Fe transport